MSSEYPSIPDPSADVQLLTDVTRALKECVEILTRQRGDENFSAATFAELSTLSSAQTAGRATIADALDDKALDAIFDRASEDAANLVETARQEAQVALTEFQIALQNVKLGLDDTNAVVQSNFNYLNAEIGTTNANLSNEQLVRATADTALAGQIQTVSAATQNNAAAISSEAVTRANADTAIGVRIDNVTAVNTGKKTFVQSTAPTATAVGQYWLDTVNNVLKRWNGSAWVGPTGDTPIEVVLASVNTENIARVAEDQAITTRIDNLVAVAPGGNSATINGVSLTTATYSAALAQQLNSVEATTNAGTANGYYRLTALSNPTDGAAAEFAVNVKGSANASFGEAGMRIQAFSNGTNRVKFYADQFLITNSGQNYVPFTVASGQLIANAITSASNVSGLGQMGLINKLTAGNLATYMDTGIISTAYIGDAQITNAKIASVDAGKISASSLSAISANLGTITAGYMSSPGGNMVLDLNNRRMIISD